MKKPGLILEFALKDKSLLKKEINLQNSLASSTTDGDFDVMVNEVVSREPLITSKHRPLIHKLLKTLYQKLKDDAQAELVNRDYYLSKVLRTHILPLTNCAFNKSGDKFITGSYDRTCKVFETESGNELFTLEGHRNVVYAISFNNPYGDKIVTASFDRSCKLWDAATGNLCNTFCGHEMEIVCVETNPLDAANIATGSMDKTARIWDTESGACLHTLIGHGAEVISLHYDTCGKHVITGSFDNTVRMWDVRQGRSVRQFVGHTGEISSTQFNFSVSPLFPAQNSFIMLPFFLFRFIDKVLKKSTLISLQHFAAS